MSERLSVVDTNVIVSGFLSSDQRSPPARILDGLLAARFPFLLSIELLAEYRSVLLRPKIARRHGLSEDEIDLVLGDLALHAMVVDPAPSDGPIPDGGDRHLWDLLAAQPGAVLVTGDRRLRDNPPPGATLLSARAFVETLRL